MAALPQSDYLTNVERVPWDSAVRRMTWAQGEHVVIIGTTGSGKTEVIKRLLEQRRYSVFLATKKRDEVQTQLRKQQRYKLIPGAEQIEPEIHQRIMVRPGFPKVAASELFAYHREVFRAVLMRCFRQENWTVTMDEARYLYDQLGLRDEIILLLTQGRSQGITVISATQRPVWIPREIVDQATHVFMFRPTDKAELKRMSEIAGPHEQTFMSVLPEMTRHDALYFNPHEPDTVFLTNTRW